MKWTKLGRVYVPDGKLPWAVSHAYVPTSHQLDEATIRVYVSFLDAHKIGRIGYVDLEANNPRKVIRVSKNPVLDIGEAGTFDDNGVTPTAIIDRDSKKYLYYLGWQLGVGVRYYLFAGLAISDDNGESFERFSQVPILDRSDSERFVRSAVSILWDENVCKCWYVSSNQWIQLNGKPVPTYCLRYLESRDGITWGSAGEKCLELSSDDEYGFGRPFVIKGSNCYRMFYSTRTRSKGYRIGYAESADGKCWQRKDDETGIDVSETGWDSEMICFGNILSVEDKQYMFYNGNSFGETGFGVAVLRD